MQLRTTKHSALALLTAAVLGLGQATSAAASTAPQPGDTVAVPALGGGAVVIDGGAPATASSDATIVVAPPTTPASLLQVSNDNGTTWLQIPYTTTFAWSLIDPAAGGLDADGTKSIAVEAGDGIGPWVPLGVGSILLDRTPPMSSGIYASPSGWIAQISFGASDAGVGLDHTEISLDGLSWRWWEPAGYPFYAEVDYREAQIGGSWATGMRSVYARAVDGLGNVSQVWTAESEVTATRNPGEMPATFEFPLPAVTGQRFTIKPIFDPGFHLAAGQWCEWRLKAGDAAVRLEAAYDETLIDVSFPVWPKNGVCAPWTFTLPYTPPLEYTWRLDIMGRPDASFFYTSELAGSFRAALGSTSRAITYSSLPLTYLLPDREVVGTDGIVTYRLYTAGGMALTSGMWWCESPDHPNPPQGFYPQSQTGGYSFACRVTSSGPWVAGWARFVDDRRWLVQFDPFSDRHKPVVRNLRVDPALNSRLGKGTRVTVRWSGTDNGTGVRRYEFAASRNGGAYVTIPLPARLTTAMDRPVVLGSTYRYRVRAIDRAGNVGAWFYTPVIRPAAYDDSSSAVHWAGSWTVESVSGAAHGRLHVTVAPGSTVSSRFTGRSVAWLAPRGPEAGFAQVWVDGVLITTIDLIATSTLPCAIVWRKSWTTVGTHLVRIRVLGTAGRPKVGVDGFVVLR